MYGFWEIAVSGCQLNKGSPLKVALNSWMMLRGTTWPSLLRRRPLSIRCSTRARTRTMSPALGLALLIQIRGLLMSTPCLHAAAASSHRDVMLGAQDAAIA